jgi:hypothetical protein
MRRGQQIREALEAFSREEPDRATVLGRIWTQLEGRALLPDMASMRTFGEALGLKGLRATRREQAVLEIMELLMEVPYETLERKMHQTVAGSSGLADEYERWVRLILAHESD